MHLILQFRNPSSNKDVQDIVTENLEFFSSCGLVKPVDTIKLEDREMLLRTVGVHFFVKVKAETDQYMEGLRWLGVLDAIVSYPSILKPFFCVQDKPKLSCSKQEYYY